MVASEHQVQVPEVREAGEDFEIDAVRIGFAVENGFLRPSPPADVTEGAVRLVGQRGEVFRIQGRSRTRSTKVVGRWVCGSERIEWLFVDPPSHPVRVRVVRRRDGQPIAKAKIAYEELRADPEDVFRHSGYVFSDAEGGATMFLEERRYRVSAGPPPGWEATYSGRTMVVDARRDEEVVFEMEDGARVYFDFVFHPPTTGRAQTYTLMAQREGGPWRRWSLGFPYHGYTRVTTAGVWRIMAFCEGYFGEQWVRVLEDADVQRIAFDLWPAERVTGRVVWRNGNVEDLTVRAGPKLEGVGAPPWATCQVGRDGAFALWLAGTTDRTLEFVHEGRRIHAHVVKRGVQGVSVVIE